MNSPAQVTRTLNDLIPGVTDALQGRTDITTALATRHLRKALLEITESYPFEELRVTGPTVALTTGVASYPVSLFINPGDDVTLHNPPVIFVDFPTNTVTTSMVYRTLPALEPMIAPATQGIPSRWSRHGSNFLFGPVANNPYSVYLRYQLRHPFPLPTGNATIDATQLQYALAYIPPSWEDIVEYVAAMRVAIAKRWTDQVKFLHELLYGDPEFQISGGKRGRPGLIAARLFQQERDEMYGTRQLQVVMPRY